MYVPSSCVSMCVCAAGNVCISSINQCSVGPESRDFKGIPYSWLPKLDKSLSSPSTCPEVSASGHSFLKLPFIHLFCSLFPGFNKAFRMSETSNNPACGTLAGGVRNSSCQHKHSIYYDLEKPWVSAWLAVVV